MKTSLICSVVAACCLCSSGFALAQTPSSAQIRIIVPYPPGGGTDLLARAIAQRLGEKSGQVVIVDNRPGANGTVGAGVAAKAAPDGNTMILVAAGYAAGASLYKNLPYDQERDLAPVTRLAAGPLVLVVHPSLPVRSTKDLVALAKARPGDLNVGNSGTGSLPHLSAELFGLMSGVKLVHIPYKGAGPALIDVLNGQVPVYFMNILGALPFIKQNRLRPLSVTSPERSAIAPDLPTLAETGLPGFSMTNWYGILLPGSTPRSTVLKVQGDIVSIMKLPEFTKLMAQGGMTVVASSADEFQAFLKQESEKYARVIKAAGVKLQ